MPPSASGLLREIPRTLGSFSPATPLRPSGLLRSYDVSPPCRGHAPNSRAVLSAPVQGRENSQSMIQTREAGPNFVSSLAQLR